MRQRGEGAVRRGTSALRLVLLLLCATYWPAQAGGRVAVLIKGEAFKVTSHQRGRDMGAAGLNSQRVAVASQLAFVLAPLVLDCGYESADLFVDTYRQESPELVPLLTQWYGPWLRNLTLHAPDPLGSGLRGLSTDNLDRVFADSSPYVGALLLRPDMIMKPLFSAVLAAANRSQLLFTFREWKIEDGYEQWPGIPRVADMVMWTPRWAFPVVRQDPNGFINNHNAVWVANQRFNVSVADTGFLLPHEQYDADPAKSGNPLYTLAERPEFPVQRPVPPDATPPATAMDTVLQLAGL